MGLQEVEWRAENTIRYNKIEKNGQKVEQNGIELFIRVTGWEFKPRTRPGLCVTCI